MIIKKVKVDNEVINVQITKEEAIKSLLKGDDLIFTDDEEKNEVNKLVEKINSASKEPKATDNSYILNKVNEAMDKVSEKIDNFGNSFHFNKGKKQKSKTRLEAILPFLDDEEIHEILVEYLENKDNYNDLNLSAILPFLSDEDASMLFKKALENDIEFNPEEIAPFVSEEDLSVVVEAYINGKYQDINIDSLYPFLSSKDLKKLYLYILRNQK